MPSPTDDHSSTTSDELHLASSRSPGARPTPRPSGRSALTGTIALLAVLVALIMVVGALAVPGLSAGSTHLPGVAAPASTPAPISRVVAPTAPSSAVAGACLGTGSRGTAPAASSPATGPLFNSQVTPYATYTGPYGYVAGGAALRNQGYGLINLTWPGGSTSNLVAAYMVWSILNNSVPPAYGTINGHNVTGTWTAYATPSPCWAPTYIYTFIADVSSDVVNGVNNFTAFPSGVTSGADPWSVTPVAPLDDSLSLVAIFDNSSA